MQIKAICTDIDGTLLDINRQLSKRTILAFKNVPPEVPIILASSRMPSAMRHLQAELNRSSQPLICYNGGFVTGPQINGSIVERLDTVTIPLHICREILDLVKGTAIHISLYHEDEWYAPKEDNWSKKEVNATKVNPVYLGSTSVIADWTMRGIGAHKVMCMGTEAEIESLFRNLFLNFSDQLHLYRSKETYIEIAPRAVSKASALQLLLERKYAITMEEVIAFGDNYNDIELLQRVGKGVAVENARPEVKAVAREITASNTEDGVARLLEKYF